MQFSFKKEYTDNELFDMLKSDSHYAMCEIYRRYHSVLYRHAYQKLQDKEEVRDIIQDVFISIWTTRKTLVVNNLSSYLITAVRSRVLNSFRNEKVKQRYVDSLQEYIDAGENCIEDRIEEKYLIAAIRKEISNLPPKMKLVFEMSRFENKSHNEIADLLHISPMTVRTQIRNSLRVLKSKLSKSLLFFL